MKTIDLTDYQDKIYFTSDTKAKPMASVRCWRGPKQFSSNIII